VLIVTFRNFLVIQANKKCSKSNVIYMRFAKKMSILNWIREREFSGRYTFSFQAVIIAKNARWHIHVNTELEVDDL